MNSKDTLNSPKEQTKSINEMFKGLKCDFFIQRIFALFARKKLLELIKYNKQLQKMMNININDYKIYHEMFTSIELEIEPNKQGIHGEFIRIKDEDKKYYHIYFNNNKKEEIKRYELNKDDDDIVSKINVIIDHQVTSFSELFRISTCTSIKFKKFYRINITNMNYMFYSTCFLKELDLTNFKTDNVTDMSYMFCGCPVTELNLTKFKTDKVTNMKCMFSGCGQLKELNVTNFNTNNVIDMSAMFCGCKSLKQLNLANFNTNNVKEMYNMFIGCESLKELNLDNFSTNNFTYMANMFSGCTDELKLKIKNKYPNFKNDAYVEYNYN